MKLIDAIRADNVEETRKALKKVKDINRDAPGGDRPVFIAARGGHIKVLELLLDSGANPHWPSLPNGSALGVAADHGAVDSLRILLERIKPYPEDELYWAAVNAARFDNIACLQPLKLAGAPLDGAAEAAAAGGHVAALKWLLQQGVSAKKPLRIKNSDGKQTLLHVAANSATAGIVPLLMEAGADVNALDGDDRTPLMIAAEQEPTTAMDRSMFRQRMEEAKQSGQEVRLAPPPAEANCTVVEALLDAGADATLTDADGSDAMRIFLNEYEQDTKSKPTKDDDQHFRLKLDRAKKIHARLKAAGGPGPNPANDALLKAASAGDLASLRAALKKGADVSARNVGGATALRLAAGNGYMKAVQALLDAGADVNDAGRSSTPLISAAHSGHLDVVKLLVKAGADIHRKESTTSDYTALVLAKINMKDDVVRYLKSVGARYPLRADWKPPMPGVAMWENFEDLLVRADAELAAKAIAKLIGAKQIEKDAYDRELKWKEPCYVVLRVKGMDWTNVVRVPHDLWRLRKGKEYDTFAADLAKQCKSQALWVGYSDAAGASSVVRYGDGKTTAEDDGWDADLLEEAIGVMEEAGEKVPADMKKRLKQLKTGRAASSDLKQLAAKEKLLCGAFGFNATAGKPLVVEFLDYPAEAFDAVWFVSR